MILINTGGIPSVCISVRHLVNMDKYKVLLIDLLIHRIFTILRKRD